MVVGTAAQLLRKAVILLAYLELLHLVSLDVLIQLLQLLFILI